MDFVSTGGAFGTLGPGWVLWRDCSDGTFAGYVAAPWHAGTTMLVRHLTCMYTGALLPDCLVPWEFLTYLTPLDGPPHGPLVVQRQQQQHFGFGGGYAPSPSQFNTQPPRQEISRDVAAAPSPPLPPVPHPKQHLLTEGMARLRFTIEGSAASSASPLPPPLSLSSPRHSPITSAAPPLSALNADASAKPRTRGERRDSDETLAKRLLAAESALAALRQENDNLKEARVCVICIDNARELVLLPCAHFALCKSEGCRRSMGTPAVCPVCRGTVRSTLQIYL